MKQEVVLPKLRVPGQPSWLIRGLFIGGFLVAAWLVVIGVALWRRGTVAQQLAAVPAPAPAPVAPAAVPPPAPAGQAPAPARPAVPARAPASAVAGKGMPGKLGTGRRLRGGRFARAGTYAKSRGKARAGGRRALAARKAFLRKKRWLAARAAARRGSPAAASARAPGKLPATAAQKSARPGAKGDPIDDILRNFPK